MLFIGCSDHKPVIDSITQPELSSPFDRKSLKYLGNYYNNHVYVDTTAGSDKLKDAFGIHVFIASEDYSIILRNPMNSKMAIYDPSLNNKDIGKLVFFDPPDDSMAMMAWAIASGKSKPERIKIGHNGRQWAYVTISGDDASLKLTNIYVLPKIDTNSQNGMESITILALNQQWQVFIFNKAGTEFSSIACDPLWSPSPFDEVKPRKVSEYAVARALWKFITENTGN